MPDQSPNADTGEGPRESPSGTPRWVKLFWVVIIAVVLLVVILLLIGGHGPRLHM